MRVIVVRDGILLSEPRPSDAAALCAHLQDDEIFENTLTVPRPYTPAHAEHFLGIAAEANRVHHVPTIWAIREADDFLIGVVGFKDLLPAFRAEVGYWIARDRRGQGLASDAVHAACAHAFVDHNLARIVAHVFPHNPASARVLEKCGFCREGYLRKHFQKGERLLDAIAYGLLREELPPGR
jgi:RimJ/RimL family protein N-acetyltransferase